MWTGLYATLHDPSSWENNLYTGKILLLLSGQLKPTMHFVEINHQRYGRNRATMSLVICSGNTGHHNHKTKFLCWKKPHASKHEWCSEYWVLKDDIF
jgi:hypothetical protein